MMTVYVAFPPQLEEALALLRHEGVAAWLVGGYVRDALLNRPSHDADIVVQAGGLHWARRLADALGGAFVPLDEENDIGRVVFRTRGGLFVIDVSRVRGGSIEADLTARDFTINALALAAEDGRLLDVTGGYADLNRRVVRMVSRHTFEDDPLRLMRGVRMVATLGFVLDAATILTTCFPSWLHAVMCSKARRTHSMYTGIRWRCSMRLNVCGPGSLAATYGGVRGGNTAAHSTTTCTASLHTNNLCGCCSKSQPCFMTLVSCTPAPLVTMGVFTTMGTNVLAVIWQRNA